MVRSPEQCVLLAGFHPGTCRSILIAVRDLFRYSKRRAARVRFRTTKSPLPDLSRRLPRRERLHAWSDSGPAMDHRERSEKTCSACRLLLLRFLASTKTPLELPRHLKEPWPRLDRCMRASQSV